MTSWVNDSCKSRCTLRKLAKIGIDDRYKVRKSTKFQNDSDISDGDMTSQNLDVIPDDF